YKKNGQTVYTTSNPSKGYPYYLVFKTQETAGNGISAAKVQIGTPTPTPTPTAPPTPSPTPTPTPMPTPTPTPTAEVVLYASEGVWVGNYLLTSDPTAAGGARLDNPDDGAPKLSSALANPGSYVELQFTAEAGVGYRLWIRGKAQDDSPYNDSI